MNRTHVDELVSAWQEARDRGVPPSVGDLCRESPELVSAVAERLAALGDMGTWAQASAETSQTVDLPAPPVSSLPSSLGGYRLEKILGQGGMGTVYLAHDDRLGRAVALKAMKPEIAALAEAKHRFLREARAVAQVEHDNIIPIWQVGEDAGVPFFAMPLLHGESLASRLQRERVSPLGVILKVGREVAEGLAAAHAHGLIHRDVKPANVWLEGDPKAADAAARFRRCKLLDFGLARPLNDDAHLTASGTMVGTPAYMSPEQAAGNPVDIRTDLFSLGALLYRMATGEQPFAGPSVMAVLTSLAVHNPPPATTKNLSVPAPLSELIMKLMTKDPTGRPGSAREVAAALREMNRRLVAARKAGSAAPAEPTSDTTLPLARQVVERTLPPPRATAPSARKARPGGAWKWLAAALFAAVAVVAGVVIIKVTGPDGKETTVEVPSGSTVKVDPKGRVEVELPRDPKALPKPVATDSDRRVAEWALGCGGKVQIKGNDIPTTAVAAAKDLPVAPFLLIRVILDGCGDKVTDAGLERLKGLAGITHLYLARTSVTDAGLDNVKGLTSLVDLYLPSTAVTDAGLAKLKGLTKLKQLTVYQTRVTDAGLEHLKGLTGLTYLDLDVTQVTDAGLEHLSELTELLQLGLGATRVTDAGLKHLSGSGKLARLELGGTQITDVGLTHLKGLAKLTHLYLSETQVTDAGLEHLTGLANLVELHLGKTKVTPAGAEKLRKALPNCKVLTE